MAAQVFLNGLATNATALFHQAVAATKPLSYDIYQHTDLTQLNVVEKAWMAWYQYWGNPILATGECYSLVRSSAY